MWSSRLVHTCNVRSIASLFHGVLHRSPIYAEYIVYTMTDRVPGTSVLVGNQFEQLVVANHGTQTQFNEKLEEFKDKVCQGQEDAATKALKRTQYNGGYTFHKKGNETQMCFTEKVQELVMNAQALITAPREPPAIQRAKDAPGERCGAAI